MKTSARIITTLVSAIVFVQGAAQAAPRKPKVVTTLSVLKAITQEIGGNQVSVEALSDARQDPHFVEPRPTLMKKTREADVFIETGLQLELWAQKVIDGAGNTKIQTGQPGRVIASNGISTLELPTNLSREWGDVHPYGNPHIWLDPINAKAMAANIAKALQAADPGNSKVYAERLKTFENKIDVALFGKTLIDALGSKKLTRLSHQGRLWEYLERKELTDKVGGWLLKAKPLRGQNIVTFHKTWIYFARRFGLSIATEIEAKPGIPPSAKQKDHVIATIKKDHVGIILLASFYDRSAADYIAKRTGATVLQVPIGPGTIKGVDTYFELMDYLIDQMTSSRKQD